MTTYNHMCTVAFTVVSKNDGESLTNEELKAGLLQRVKDLDSSPGEWSEACLPAVDTYIESEG